MSFDDRNEVEELYQLIQRKPSSTIFPYFFTFLDEQITAVVINTSGTEGRLESKEDWKSGNFLLSLFQNHKNQKNL